MPALLEPLVSTPQATKLGLIFAAEARHAWMHSHAALPTVLQRDKNVFDVYFCSRDAQSRSQIGRFTLDVDRPDAILYVSTSPLLGPGALGTFDDSGVTPASVVREGDRILLYYTGWMLGHSVPFYYSVGLAVSDDGGKSFHRVSRAPILDRNDVDPCLTASPCVLKDGDRWQMWYVS